MDIQQQLKDATRLMHDGNLEQAELQDQKVLEIDPNQAFASFCLGYIHQRQSNFADAIAFYEKAIYSKPNYIEALHNLGNTYKEQQNPAKAIEAYQRVIQLKPDSPDTYVNLGAAWRLAGNTAEAIAAYQRAIQLDSSLGQAYSNLGNALDDQGRLSEAIAAYERALQLNPNSAQACGNLANTLKDQGRLDEAIMAYERALQLNPDNIMGHSNRLLALNYGRDNPSNIYVKHREWAERQTAELRIIKLHHNRDQNRRLRIGYVSGDLKEHSVANFLEALLITRDRTAFAITCYANNIQVDAVTQRLQQLSDHWRDIYALNDRQIVELIRQDEIDILVDLSGHTKGNRLLVFAHKPAPVQISYIGYPNTTGLDTVDYRFTDGWADSEGQTEPLHTEQLVRLPHGFLCYQPRLDCPEVGALPVLAAIVGADEAIAGKPITFGSFNALPKVNSELVSCWSAMLAAVPQSRLMLKAKGLADAATCEYVTGLFKAQGIGRDRLQLLGQTASQQDHLALYNQIDIALDTFPYNGTATTCEALWMGVPVITLAGRTHVGRVGVSLLSSIGLPELIADSTEAYIQKAVELAHDVERLQVLRASLRDRMRAAPLMNAELITQSVESAYRRLWHNYVHHQTAKMHRRQGRLKEAAQTYQTILANQANDVVAHFALGSIYQEQKYVAEAIAAYQRAVDLKPDLAEAHINLGMALRSNHQLAEAIAAYKRGLQLKPDCAEAYNNLGNALKESGKFGEATAAYQQALQIRPNYPVAHSNFLFSLNYDSSYAPLAVYQEHRQWAARQAAAFTQSVRPHANNTDLNRRLRIGYVSNDFKTHSVAYFLEPLLAAHNHQRFEVIGYSNNDFEDATTQRLKQQVHRWQNIASLSPEQAADCIRQDQVDILVDLSGHTKRHRLLVFAGKPAPVQVTYLGYPNTTGLDAIDYRLTDTWADPVGQTEHWHVEHLVRLPHGFLCYQPPSNCPAVGPLPALASMSAAAATIATRPITFGSFNNLAKVSPSVVAHWAAILRAVPQARMVIKARALGASGTCGYLFDLFEQQGIERDRLDLIAWMPAKQDHLALYNQIDIALDTFPYSGTTTTCEALWMGVPVITLAGQTHVSRVGVSILASAGLPELIADSAQAYIQKAVDLANDLEHLQVLRASLRDRLQASPLTNADLITQSIEQAYRAMWQSWCEEQHKDGNQPSLKSQLKAAKKAFDSDDLAQAKSQYQAILAQELEHTKAHFYLGVIAQKQGHAAEAIAAYQQVVDLQPDFVAALWNLGNLHKEQEQYDAAIECYRQLIELKPQESDYYADLGSALRSKGQNAEAIAAYDEALQLDPNFAKAHCNRGNVLLGQCKVAEAIAGYRRALAIRPDYTSASNNLLMTLNYSPDEDPVAVYEEHRRWAATQAAAIASPIIHHPQRRAGDRRLRIGYVSGDLKTHSVSDFLQPLLANRDATKFETICYANNRRTDGQTKRLRKLADGWRDISMLSDAAVTDLIRQDQVDILVDLSGHTKDNRLLVFAQKPAPVQITYIGYPNTTGLSAMDYRFTDAWADPEGQTEHLYTEQLVRLPHGFLCYRPVRDCPAVNPLPALATGRITFGSFNSLFKVTPQLIAHWAAIMTAVPDSQLILKARPLADPDTRSHIHHLFDQQGITSDRVQLRDRIKKRKNHIALYHQIDIALDTFPYNGTTTTCEALWMGVPVITLAGRVHAARMGLSRLSAVGLTELIADSTEDYVQRAIALANDLARLQTLRASLRDRLQNAPLTNAKLITQSLEDAYRTMWQDFSDKHTLESDQRLVEIKGGVQVCVQDDISKLTTYVLMEQGDWFEAEMDFVRRLITPGMEVLDIGANHGVYTLTMAHALQGQGRITAYEPDESVVRHLRQSIHANAFETVEVVVAGLSGQAGEATFFLSTNSEMNSLQQSSAKQKQVTIQLLTLDAELERHGWQDITFVKLDAEGEEGKILDGGQRFFAEQSPLVMFELKHGQQVNLPLIDRFKQLGCDIYRLVPGLGFLVPFDVNQPVDGYQLNLFACKGDRAQQLAERGLLVQAIEAPPALPAPHYWLDAMAQFAYAQSVLSQFEILQENTNQDRQQYLDGLSYFFLAQGENRAITERAAALQIAFEQLHRAAQRKSSFARQCSLARVAAAWGQRSISVQALKGLAKTQTSHQSVQIDEPFLPVSDRYDALAFSDHLPDWLFVSIIETYERSYCFSSYYATQRSVSLLDQVVSKPFHSGQAERRFSLAQKRLKGDRQWMEPASSNVSLDPDQRLIETQDGIQVCVKNDVSSMTTYVLLEQGDWFEAEMDFVRRLITPGMQVLDVGANHGVYTLPIAKLLQGQGQVFAYEPDDLVLRHLRQSIAANALDTIEIIAAGLSGHEGEATFFLSPNSELNSLHKTKDTETKVTIQLLTLDKELERHGWQNIEFIKLDAEGEEVVVIQRNVG